MTRLRLSFLLTLTLFFGASPVFAASYAVGTCKPSLPSYSSISAAVAAVPGGSTVMVCPGTYAEQITISQPLTLMGISSGDSGQVIITVPGGGLALNTTSLGGLAVAAQVLVETGPVNITNITVDGAGNNLNGSADVAGVFYDSGSSGVVNQVTTRNQIDSTSPTVQGQGAGIWAQNGNATSESVTIENCSVHDFDLFGIIIESNQTPSSLTATVRANNVSGVDATFFVFAILIESGGNLTGNTITGPGTSLFAQAITGENSAAIVSGNVVTNWQFGIVDFSAGTYTSNTVRNTFQGITLDASGVTVKSNIITESAFAILMFCHYVTATNNTINDAFTGIDSAPSSFSSANAFFNVNTIRTGGCSDATPAVSGGTGTHAPRKAPQI